MKRPCDNCGTDYEAKRKTSKYCSKKCSVQASRRRKSATQPAEEPKPEARVDDGLVSAVRTQLAEADRLDTVPGQLALQLARKLVDVDATGVSGLSKELRAVLAEALAGVEQPCGAQLSEPAVDDVDDEIAKAREARERKAREAAGRA